VRNLLIGDRVERSFVDELLELRQRVRDVTAPRLRRLTTAAAAALPAATRPRNLEKALGELQRSLDELPGSVRTAVEARVWVGGAEAALLVLRDGLPALLEEIDRHCATGVAEALQELVAFYEEAGYAENVQIEFWNDLPDSEHAVVAKEDLLAVLENLVENAVAAMASAGRGRLVLRAERDGDGLVVDVSDSGPGVPPRLRERIFDYGVTTRGKGRGYGLARSREILAHYGGSLVLLTPTDGAGTTFRATLRRLSSACPRPVGPAFKDKG
jgi:signal transduction histidine kinase